MTSAGGPVQLEQLHRLRAFPGAQCFHPRDECATIALVKKTLAGVAGHDDTGQGRGGTHGGRAQVAEPSPCAGVAEQARLRACRVPRRLFVTGVVAARVAEAAEIPGYHRPSLACRRPGCCGG